MPSLFGIIVLAFVSLNNYKFNNMFSLICLLGFSIHWTVVCDDEVYNTLRYSGSNKKNRIHFFDFRFTWVTIIHVQIIAKTTDCV